jgi:hypothetical protein
MASATVSMAGSSMVSTAGPPTVSTAGSAVGSPLDTEVAGIASWAETPLEAAVSFCTSRACARQNPAFPPLLAQRPVRKRPFLVIFPLDLHAVSGVAARCSLTFSWSVSAAASYSRGTEGSNPAPSSSESANFWSLSGGRIGWIRVVAAHQLHWFSQNDLIGHHPSARFRGFCRYRGVWGRAVAG